MNSFEEIHQNPHEPQDGIFQHQPADEEATRMSEAAWDERFPDSAADGGPLPTAAVMRILKEMRQATPGTAEMLQGTDPDFL